MTFDLWMTASINHNVSIAHRAVLIEIVQKPKSRYEIHMIIIVLILKYYPFD